MMVSTGAEAATPGPFVVGASLGVIFPQAFSELGSHALVGLELGYRLPYVGQRIEIMVDVGYSPPGRSTDISRDEGSYKAEVVSQQLHFSLAPRVRVMPGPSRWNVTVAIGPRLMLLRSSSNGSRDGQAFAEFIEESTKVGIFVAVGGEYVLGHGALFADLSLEWSKMGHRIMGDGSTGDEVAAGDVALRVGYRLFMPWW